MSTQNLITLSPNDTMKFACHPGVTCFNHCCRDLNQALTPYDTLRLRAHLNLTSGQFLQRYLAVHTGPASGLPIASLRFTEQKDRLCPFAGKKGCTVYPARPSSCRIYPLVRALRRSRADGKLKEQYALLQESHCRGFQENKTQTIAQWLTSQELKTYFKMNDALLALIALKNQLNPAPLSPEQRHWVKMAFYDLDALKQKALDNQLMPASHAPVAPLPDDDDEQWLAWAMQWICAVLSGQHHDVQMGYTGE